MKFGFSCSEVSQVALLFKADIQSVFEALSKVTNVTSYEPYYVLGKPICPGQDSSLLLLKMKGYDWIVMFPHSSSWLSSVSTFPLNLEEKVQTLSSLLESSVVEVRTTDTGDFSCFWHFKSGVLVDKLENVYEKARGYEDRELSSELVNYLLESSPDFVVDTYFHYIVSSEGIDKVLPIDQMAWENNSFALTERFLQKEEIYLPSLLDFHYAQISGNQFRIQSFESVNVERLAIISTGCE